MAHGSKSYAHLHVSKDSSGSKLKVSTNLNSNSASTKAFKVKKASLGKQLANGDEKLMINIPSAKSIMTQKNAITLAMAAHKIQAGQSTRNSKLKQSGSHSHAKLKTEAAHGIT